VSSITFHRTIGKLDALDIWTAPIEAVISETGPVRTRRTDLLLTGRSGQGASACLHHTCAYCLSALVGCPPPVRLHNMAGFGAAAGGVHLVFWGSIDSQIDGKVDVTLGLPAETLQRLG
jgi:hypothetical protein